MRSNFTASSLLDLTPGLLNRPELEFANSLAVIKMQVYNLLQALAEASKQLNLYYLGTVTQHCLREMTHPLRQRTYPDEISAF